MNIAVQSFDPNRIATVNRLFSDEIDSDLWIMFHGTSGFNANSIERDGFAFPNSITPDRIKRVTDLYKEIKWLGENFGGYAILKSFSLDHDFIDDGSALLFFAETSIRALRYAQREFSGGEKLRALRLAFRDLDSYLAQSEVRERHEQRMTKEFEDLARLNAPPPVLEPFRPKKIDLDWLTDEMTNLKDIRQLADEPYERHDHGIVYALQMTLGDVDGLRLNSSMGIKATRQIEASKIVSKIVVPAEYKLGWLADGGDELMRRMTSGQGLFAAMKARTP